MRAKPIVAGLAACAALAAPAAAPAAPYVVDFCKTPSDAPATLLPGLSNYGNAGFVADCHVGGPNGGIHGQYTGATQPPAALSGFVLAVPPDRPGLTIVRAQTRYRLAPVASGSRAFMRFIGGSQILEEAEAPADRSPDAAMPPGTRRLEWQLFCSTSGSTSCNFAQSGDVFHVYRARLQLDEGATPTLDVKGGSLTAAGPRSGMQTVAFDAGDADSGVKSVSVQIGSTTVGSVEFPCPADDWSACARDRAGQTLTVDTAKGPDGAHPVSVVARDAAGNAVTRPAGTATIANGPPMIPNGAGASRQAKLSVAHASTRKRSRRVRLRSQPTMRGRLVNEAGAAIAGARVVVSTRLRQAGADLRPVTTATTGADGRFSHKLAGGPARTVTFSYTAFSSDPAPASASSLRTLVRARLSARPAPRSPRTRGRFRVNGRLIYAPRRGVEVRLQARDGRRWRSIGEAKTRSRGRFTVRYRFKRSSAGRTFRMRARVSSPLYPFTTGYSRAFRVRVR